MRRHVAERQGLTRIKKPFTTLALAHRANLEWTQMLPEIILLIAILTSPITIGCLVLWSAHRGYVAAQAKA